MITILIIIALILLNGLFVAAEFAIVGAPRSAIDRAAEQGDRRSRLVSRILNDATRQDRYIATAQLGITLASLGLGMYGEHKLAEWLYVQFSALDGLRWLASHALASIVAVAILTYFHIVVGEMVPKSIALQRAATAARYVTPIMLGIQKLFYPLVLALNGIGNGLLRLVGVHRSTGEREQYHTAEELEFIIKESHEGGVLEAEQAHLLRELFDFRELTAGEVMIPRVRVRGIPSGASRGELEQILADSPYSRYPVYEGDLDHMRGVLHVKELLRALVEDRSYRTEDLRPIAFVSEQAPLEVVLDKMREVETEFAVVMDEHGGTAGIVTIEDLFEEIVGEIDDGAQVSREIFRDVDGTLHVSGTVRIEEVGEHLGIVLIHEEVDTVSGLVIAVLNRPPRVGDEIVYRNVQFEVVAVEGQGVGECVVRYDREHQEEPDSPENDGE